MSTVHIRLSADRAIQLAGIAKSLDTTIAGLIDSLVTMNLIDGLVRDETPGIEYRALDNRRLEMRIGGELVVVPVEDARDLAGLIEGPKTRTLLMTRDHRETFEVGRIGRSIELKVGQARRLFTQSVARDVARQMRAACDEAEKLSV